MQSQNSIRIAKNTLYLYFRMLITMGVALYTSRVVIDVLGIEDYGLYNVVGGAVGLFTFFSASMQSATQRFLMFELGQSKYDKYNEVFNASLLLYVGIAILILIFAETLGLWYVTNKLNVPHGREDVVNLVYQISIFSMIISILRIPHASGIIAQEKMVFFAQISILESLLKLGLVFLLTKWNYDKLILYSVLILVSTLCVNFVFIIYCAKDSNSLYKITFAKDKVLYKNMLDFTGWRFLGASSQITEKEGIALLINAFFSTAVNAANGIAWQVNIAFSSLVNNFMQAYQPQIVKYYANDDDENLAVLVTSSAKLSFFLLSIFALPLLINMPYILALWLVDVPQYAVEYSRLIIIITIIEALGAPLWMVILSTGNIAKYQLLLSLIIITGFFVNYLCLKSGYGPTTVYYVRVVFTMFVLIFRYLLLKYYYRISFASYGFNGVIKPVIVFTILTLLIFILIGSQHGFYRLISSVIVEMVIYPVVIYYFLLDDNEKQFTKRLLKKYYPS